MRNYPLMLILAMACFLSGCQTARPQPRPAPAQAVAASQGLETLKQIVNANNFSALGFASLDEARQATLGTPLSIYQVRLDALNSFNAQSNPEALLADVRRSLYPVKAGNRVATSVFVTEAKDGWRATELGNAAVAQLVSRYRHGADDFLVHVPALKAYFIGERSDGTLLLTPVMDDPRAELRAGGTLPAEVVFIRLQQAIAGYNGLPQ